MRETSYNKTHTVFIRLSDEQKLLHYKCAYRKDLVYIKPTYSCPMENISYSFPIK